ncbi:carboxypeptidase-like regulatory domain-containing protein [Pontibacter sp. H249]|uniref:carboxypeptidase-like regulatory domain-containing protein n=1 Tax=Pontibacter sp. H249 TaxID=3133420 RepID=UPI0030BBD73E
MKKIIPLLAVAMLLFGCEDSVLDPTTEATGTVIDHITKQPIAGATVTLSENDDVLLGGARVIAEQKTDAKGKFAFKFEWKESPYKLRVTKPDYTFVHVEHNERFENLPSVVTDYRVLKSLTKKQDFVLDMEPVGSLVVNIRNTQPQPNTNKITVRFENVSKRVVSIWTETFTGNGIEGYNVGGYATANKYVRYTRVTEINGMYETKIDSIFIKHVTPTVLDINY